jgi:hypothetical protein
MLILKEPRRVRITTDSEAAAALEAVRLDGIPRIIERDGEEVAAIVQVNDLPSVLDWNPSQEDIERSLASAGGWRGLGGDDLAEKIHRWRREAPIRPPLET